MTRNPETLPPHYRWNFGALLVDYVCFGVALTFANTSSVLPAFVGQLTTSAPVIGLVATVFRGGWLLPQLAAARLVAGKPRKKPYMLAGMSGRVTFWIVALALWAGLARRPTHMLILFFTCFGLWAASDGVASLVWFDIFARALPIRRRGRFLGMGQVISGLVGVGAGALVGLILERSPFPNNYALLFSLAGTVLIPSTIALAAIREPPADATEPQASAQANGGWLRPLLTDPTFRLLMACRMLIGMIDLAIPFYVGHAEKVLHLPTSIVGGFVVAQTLAGVVASPLLGLVSERWGSLQVARIGSAMAATGPLFALAAHLAGGGWLAQAYPFVYVALGVVNSSWMMGFFNYMLEIAPAGMRPAYVGLGNTIMGLLTVVPMAGGWLLEATSYTTLFGMTTVLAAAGFLLALQLKPAPQSTPVAQDAILSTPVEEQP